MNPFFSSTNSFRVPFVWALIIGVLIACVISLPALVHGLFTLIVTGIVNLLLIAMSLITVLYGVPAVLNGQIGGLVWIFARAVVVMLVAFVWARMLGVTVHLFSWSSVFDAVTALILALAIFFYRRESFR